MRERSGEKRKREKRGKKKGTIDGSIHLLIHVVHTREQSGGSLCTPYKHILRFRVRYLNSRVKVIPSRALVHYPRFYIPDALEFTNIGYEDGGGRRERNLLKNRAVAPRRPRARNNPGREARPNERAAA